MSMVLAGRPANLPAVEIEQTTQHKSEVALPGAKLLEDICLASAPPAWRRF